MSEHSRAARTRELQTQNKDRLRRVAPRAALTTQTGLEATLNCGSSVLLRLRRPVRAQRRYDVHRVAGFGVELGLEGSEGRKVALASSGAPWLDLESLAEVDSIYRDAPAGAAIRNARPLPGSDFGLSSMRSTPSSPSTLRAGPEPASFRACQR